MEKQPTVTLMRPYEVVDYLKKYMPFSRVALHYYKNKGALLPIATITFAGKEMGLYAESSLLEFIKKREKVNDVEKAFGYVPRSIRIKLLKGEEVKTEELSSIKKHYPSWIKRKDKRRSNAIDK